MSDDGQNEGQQEPGLDETDPRDGLINFTRYSVAQLNELRYSFDRQRSPINYSNLLAELKRREDTQPGESGAQFRIRWTTHDGLRGWIEALSDRLPFYGLGFAEPKDSEIVVGGWQRTWLGIPIQSEQIVNSASIRNVHRDGSTLEFGAKKPWRIGRQFRFQTESAESAATLKSLLPSASEKTSAELQAYNRQLRLQGARVWVTPALVLANALLFAAMAISNGSLTGFDAFQLALWGGIAGELMMGGQWWRLLSYMFVHFNWLHLLLNMWVLWSVGRLVERVFGNLVFLTIYLAAGILAGLSSLVWNPNAIAVGASGAIFGILGAFLSYLLRGRTHVPASIFRSHWIPALLFVAFNLMSGVTQPSIDNAAHVGGLLSGIALGWILARPTGMKSPTPEFLLRLLGAGSFVVICAACALFYLGVPNEYPTVTQRYFAAHPWYPEAEAENLSLWQKLSAQSVAGTISDADLSIQMREHVLPFWIDADKRLKAQDGGLTGDERTFGILLQDFVLSRERWAKVVVDVARTDDQSRLPDVMRMATLSSLAQARVARIELRAQLDHGVRPLADSSFAIWLRSALVGWACVAEPSSYERGPAVNDARDDGPAARRDTGCLAQRLFMTGDYRALEALMNRDVRHLSDLPDGSSHFQGIVDGLGNLFQFGGLTLEQAMTRTSDWRRSLPGTVDANLVETQMLIDWAYSARGTGNANTVSAQAQQIYDYRNEMASGDLNEIASRASKNPFWYQLALWLGRNRAVELARLRQIYTDGSAKFPDYLPLQRRMLNILMPRWYGSYDLIDQFISQSAGGKSSITDVARYARLYLMYGVMEGEDFDVVKDAHANESAMRAGVSALLHEYPRSDYILNTATRFSCIDGDWIAYNTLRPELKSHSSATAWPDQLSVAECDLRANYNHQLATSPPQ